MTSHLKGAQLTAIGKRSIGYAHAYMTKSNFANFAASGGGSLDCKFF